MHVQYIDIWTLQSKCECRCTNERNEKRRRDISSAWHWLILAISSAKLNKVEWGPVKEATKIFMEATIKLNVVMVNH